MLVSGNRYLTILSTNHEGDMVYQPFGIMKPKFYLFGNLAGAVIISDKNRDYYIFVATRGLNAGSVVAALYR